LTNPVAKAPFAADEAPVSVFDQAGVHSGIRIGPGDANGDAGMTVTETHSLGG